MTIVKIDSAEPLPREAGDKAHGLQPMARVGLRFPPLWVVLPGASGADIDSLADELRPSGHWSFAGVHETLFGMRVDAFNEEVKRRLSALFIRGQIAALSRGT